MLTWPRNTWVNVRTSVVTYRSVSKPGSARHRSTSGRRSTSQKQRLSASPASSWPPAGRSTSPPCTSPSSPAGAPAGTSTQARHSSPSRPASSPCTAPRAATRAPSAPGVPAAGGRADHRGCARPTPLPAVAEPTFPGRGPTPARGPTQAKVRVNLKGQAHASRSAAFRRLPFLLRRHLDGRVLSRGRNVSSGDCRSHNGLLGPRSGPHKITVPRTANARQLLAAGRDAG